MKVRRTSFLLFVVAMTVTWCAAAYSIFISEEPAGYGPDTIEEYTTSDRAEEENDGHDPSAYSAALLRTEYGVSKGSLKGVDPDHFVNKYGLYYMDYSTSNVRRFLEIEIRKLRARQPQT